MEIRKYLEVAEANLNDAATAHFALMKAWQDDNADAVNMALETIGIHIDGAARTTKAAHAMLKADAYTEGEHGQQLVGYNLDGRKPKKNGADSKTQSQVAFLL